MQNFIDGLIRYVSPSRALQRAQARMALREVESFMKRRFDGASKTSRFKQWKRPNSSADAAMQSNLPMLRNSSRDLTRNNPWHDKGLTVIENNAVGTGIKAVFVHKNENVEKETNALWMQWTKDKLIDADDKLHLAGIQSLCIRTIAESGSVLIRRRYRRNMGKDQIPLQLQILEPDYLDSSRDGKLKNGGFILGGIEYDKSSNVKAYWLYEEHPGDAINFNYKASSNRIPASDIIHAFDVKRPGQKNGYPWSSNVIRRLKDFDDYEDAQLVRQKIAACFTGFVHDMAGNGAGLTGLSKDGPEESDLDYLQPGVFEYLPAGKDIKFPSPPGVQNYGEYSTSMLLGIAAGFGITYEALTGDYSKVNFSSGRMGWIEMSRNVHRWQKNILVGQIMSQIVRWFYGGLTIIGKKNDDLSVKWMLPRREMIDPTREIPAMIKGVRAGITSLERVHNSMGEDTEEIISEIKRTNDMLDQNEIILDSDPRNINLSGGFNIDSSDDKSE